MDYSLLTEQKISEQYKGLPQDLKNVLSSANTSIVIENIATTYGLNKEQSVMLVQLVGLALLKFIGIEEMRKEMKESIEISPTLIPLIANAIYQKILFPVTNSLTPVASTPQAARPVAAATAAPTDRYREPGTQMPSQAMPPRIVNLRKPSPPTTLPQPVLSPQSIAPIQKPVTPPQPVAPKPQIPAIKPIAPLVTLPPAPIIKPAPAAPAKPSFYFAPLKKPVVPLMAQPPKPVFKLPLIEASPHEILTPKPKPPAPVEPPTTPPVKPQFILRPPGMPPADRPNDILDLRKDKGEF